MQPTTPYKDMQPGKSIELLTTFCHHRRVAPQVLTVTELTRRVKGLVEGTFPFVWVEGEISNLGVAPSGHVYFTLKDAGAQISAVMWRPVAGKLTFKIADGLQVVVTGNLSVYEKRGQYQIICTQLMPKGLGALQLAFEQLKKKLQAEGLFDPARKRPLPALPRRIGLVTSPTGAAIRDFLKIIGRRYPNIHIIINPVRVQGDGAAEEIAAAIDQFNALAVGRARPPGAPREDGQPGGLSLPVDVIIVTRGGGSLEDLWAFNEEVVARALARSRIPTVSAVGHEIDFTIADFVADLRAPTPSAAAELVVKSKDELLAGLAQYRKRLEKDLRYQISEARRRLAGCVLRHPAELVRQYQQQVDDLRHRLQQISLAAPRSRLETASEKFKLLSPQALVRNRRQQLLGDRQRFEAGWQRYRQNVRQRVVHAGAKLDLLSPKATLMRGYSITRTADGRIVKSVKAVKAGQSVTSIVLDGQFDSVVSSPPKPN
jgi:exodeoxyribonuclease VII large subunit